MAQFMRKPAPRGPILLLALTLGAGLALPGCGEEEAEPAPAPAPTPTPVPPPAPAPAPEPEPETPPLEVTFTAPAGEAPMVPDDGTDAATAMASVNSGMTVSSNAVAAVTPLFVEGASPVALLPGDNTPFQYVSWRAPQSLVVGSGATFMVAKAAIGANQEVVPSGAVTYVTCGPFRCQEGREAPELLASDTPACQGWNPTLTLEVGHVDNDFEGDAATNYGANDGFDLGWVYSSSLDFDALHTFGALIAGGESSHASGSRKPMALANMGDELIADADPSRDGVQDPCLTYDGSQSNDILKPRGCFRLKPNHLPDYAVTLTPASDVSWGRVTNRAEDPFTGLKCEAVTFRAADQADACALFEAEVEYATAPPLRVTGVALRGALWNIDLEMEDIWEQRRPPRQYRTLPFAGEDGVYNLYEDPDWRADDGFRPFGGHTSGVVRRLFPLLDEDGDPRYGDFGKPDVDRDDDPDIYDSTNPDADECTAADGGEPQQKTAAGVVTRPGSLCDSSVELEVTLDFQDFPGSDPVCRTSRTFTLSCFWDASGDIGKVVGDTRERELHNHNWSSFLECSVSARRD